MDYDVVKTSVQNAYRNFGQNDDKFYDAMNTFYKEGKKNPSVARVIMQDYINNKRNKARQLFRDTVSLSYANVPVIMYPEVSAAQRSLHGLTVNAALKSIDAEDMYKNTTQYIGKDDTFSIGTADRKEFDTKWKELYPRSHKIRERIIEANRLSMDNVTPKASWYEKVNFAETLAGYRNNYPKTFYARFQLILNNQIKEGNVTPKVKSWLKRFSYKLLINGKFGFKKG